MSERVRLDWRVPSGSWRRFREHVRDSFGALEGYLGREAEKAMKQYADSDGLDGVEERVDELVRAAGRTPGDSLKEKNIRDDEGDRTRVTARVESSVKDSFRSFAADADEPFGVVFASALDAYLDGGRAARLERKLDRVLDDATSLLSEVNDSSDDSLSVVERKTLAVCRDLGDNSFTDDELVESIQDVAGVSSEPSVEKYRRRVVDRRDVEPHPNNPDLWVPRSVAVGIVGEGVPRECRVPVELLDRADRERRVKLVLGRRAASRDGRLQLSTSDVRRDVLEGVPSASTVRDVVESVARDDGFSVVESSSTCLRVNLSALEESNRELLAEILEYRDAESSTDSSGRTELTEWGDRDDQGVDELEGDDDRDDDDQDAREELAKERARLDSSTSVRAATDGGEVD